MDFKVGEINTLIVDRKTDIGYMLINEYNDEILIHNNQVIGEIGQGKEINVFIYLDSKKRLTATMETPFITVGNPGFVKVESVVKDLGVFVNNNIPKDHLISGGDLPKEKEKWPKEGDLLFCKLKDTQSQLIAKVVSPKEIIEYLQPESLLKINDKVEAYVIKSGIEGINLITEKGHIIFVYYKHKRRDYRIGEVVEVTITNIKDDNSYNGTFLDNKVTLMEDDAKIILQYIEDNDGFIPFNMKSEVWLIEKQFNMSKASFKRALSNLYKKRLIEINEKGTTLIK